MKLDALRTAIAEAREQVLLYQPAAKADLLGAWLQVADDRAVISCRPLRHLLRRRWFEPSDFAVLAFVTRPNQITPMTADL